ncbi:MAG: DNA repair protein RecO, partial [Acidimicrobiaceae bacterium]|nr:DNA repair protein RecO [Acidimicrobiaceae bacterium]
TDAMALLEAVDHVAQEREPNPDLYRMLRGALRTLANHSHSPLLVAAFYWKLLALEGVGPVLDRCVSCESPDAPVALDPLLGGVLCRTCRPAPGPWKAGPDAVELVRRILGGELGAALSEPPSAATAEVSALAVGWMEHHLERQLRAVRALHG